MTTRRSVLGVALGLPILSQATRAWGAPKRPTIGVVVTTLEYEFWTNYIAFMRKGGDALGADIVVLSADNNPDKMIGSIQDLVSRHVDGLIFTPYWSTGPRGITLARDGGIPVVVTDTFPNLPPQSQRFPNYIAFIGPSDMDAGYQMAAHLFAAVPTSADKRKHICVVDGTPGTSVAIDRHKGLEKALSEHPEVFVEGTINGDFARDTAQTAFESLYQGHPGIRGVWSANGAMANGIIAALKNQGKQPGRDVMIVGMDLQSENLKPLEDGELVFDMGGHWLQGGFALIMLYDAINGHKLPADKAVVKLRLLPLTKDKVAQYLADYPGGVPKFDFRAHSLRYNPSAVPGAFEIPDASQFQG